MRPLTLEIKIACVAAIMFCATVTPVFAADAPTFPGCPNPGGVVLASYSDGVHGIAGDQGVYTGSDTVYVLSSSQVVQCFCPANGNGIQTNWWKASELDPEEKADFIKQGWIYIPDGSAWGLDPVDYLARNINFSCGEKGGSGGSSSSSSSSSSSTSGESGGSSSVSSIIPSILGFADTGKAIFWKRLLLLSGLTVSAIGFLILAIENKTKETSSARKTRSSRH